MYKHDIQSIFCLHSKPVHSIKRTAYYYRGDYKYVYGTELGCGLVPVYDESLGDINIFSVFTLQAFGTLEHDIRIIKHLNK